MAQRGASRWFHNPDPEQEEQEEQEEEQEEEKRVGGLDLAATAARTTQSGQDCRTAQSTAPAQGHAPLQQRGGSGGLRGKGGFPALCDFEATLYKGKDLPGARLLLSGRSSQLR